MGYVAVSGGEAAIEASIALLQHYRSGTPKDLELEAIECKLSLLVDRVMGEAGFYSRRHAALAIKQCEGSIEEAVFLLRAFRSTLTRNYTTVAASGEDMAVTRRISAAFKDIVGGQMLGATYDYTHRLLNPDVASEDSRALFEKSRLALLSRVPADPPRCPRVSDALREEGLIESRPDDNGEPDDVTERPLEFPASRSARLQTLARADTGFLSGLAYSALRGFGQVHPTVGELRTGYLELCVPCPLGGGDQLYIGEILMTEVECFSEADGGNGLKLSVGYGAAFGRNENKAIAMAILDRELEAGGPFPAQDEEFVLTHGDSLEASGFLSHLKLPHYVTFQSKLDAVRRTRRTAGEQTV